MVIKFFDEFQGQWIDISGNTGATLVKGANDWTTSQGYLVYCALLSQSGTNVPTYTELDNTTGSTITPTYVGSGQYKITFADSILSQGKTMVFIQQNDGSVIQAYRSAIDEITIRTSADGILYFTSLEIRIYN